VDSGVVTRVIISNTTKTATTVNVSFGADSAVTTFAFCSWVGGQCTFPLAASASQELPLAGAYLNATFAFGGAVACGNTISEITANNANGYGTADVSLVNGYSNNISVTIVPGPDGGPLVLGPPAGASGNAQVFGVYPLACDICVARSQPPCGFDAGGCTTPASCGCKSGTQYNPTVPCQATYQQSTTGSIVTMSLTP